MTDLRESFRGLSPFVAPSLAVMVTAVTSVAKSHYRQTARVAEGLPDRRWEEDPKPNVVTSSDGSEMVTETNKVVANPCKEDAQNQC